MNKNNLLLAVMMISSLAYSQQQQYVFDFESGDPDGVATNWITFDNTPAAAEIIDNPDLDGVNNTASKVLKVVVGSGNAFYAGVNNRWEDGAFGTWKIDAAIASNLTVSMDINKNYTGTVGIKMGTNTGATSFQITDQNVGNTVVDEWQTLTWTISSIPTTLETNVNQFVIFVDWRENMPDRADGSTILIDNITFNAEKLTDPVDPVAPTCSDGVQNGDETGIDCGGATCTPCAVTQEPEPQVSASVNNYGTLFSLFSDSFSSTDPSSYTQSWGQGEVEDFAIGTDNIKKYTNLNFQAITLASTIDLAPYTHFHIDVWTPDANAFAIKFQDFGADDVDEFPNTNDSEMEVQSSTTQTSGTWVGHDFAIADFTGLTNTANLGQIQVLLGSAAGGTQGTAFVDNLYFYDDTTLSINSQDLIESSVYPNPSKGAWNIVTSNTAIKSVEVYNILGKKVYNKNTNSTQVAIPTNGLARGIYLAKIYTGLGTKSLKLIRD